MDICIAAVKAAVSGWLNNISNCSVIPDSSYSKEEKEMKHYIGTKIVKAWPEWKHYGADGNVHYVSHEPALLVGESSEAGYGVLYEDGYKSWSPMTAFEKAYRETTGMPFGLAIEAAKMGKKIARAGWNGKGMWVIYRTGYPDGIPCNKNTADSMGIPEGTVVKIRPYLQMKCVDDTYQMWLASQSDILADDWYIVE